MHSPPLWTAEQLAVLDALELSDDPLSVESCAGSGKSTVLLECAHRLAARHEPVRVAAFGREATAKLKARLAPLLATHRRFVEVRSIYGAGFVALDDHFGGSRESRAARMREEQGGGPEAPPARVSIKPGQTPAQALAATRDSTPEPGWTFDADATKQRCLEVAERVTSKPTKLAESLHEIVDAAKNTLVDPTDLAGLGRVAWGLALARNEADAARLAALASEVLQATLAEPRRGDYRDMGWLAAMLDVIPVFPGTVLLDEAQDLNPLEHEIVRRMCGGSGPAQSESAPRAGARLVQFGDPTQAIFGWNGAVPDGMRRLAASVGAVRMQLSVSFRCPLRVTQEANVFNPSMQSDPSCGPGDVRKNVEIPQMLREIEPGAVVLSRSGQGAFQACLALREAGKQAVVATHGAVRSLLRLANLAGGKTVAELTAGLLRLEESTRQDLGALQNCPEHATPLLHMLSEIEILRALSAGQKTVADVKRLVQQTTGRGRTYKDAQAQSRDPSTVIRCGTVHWFKGQEAFDVWVLEDTFHDAYGPRATAEGRNVLNVAVTRSQQRLVFVTGKFTREASGQRFW